MYMYMERQSKNAVPAKTSDSVIQRVLNKAGAEIELKSLTASKGGSDLKKNEGIAEIGGITLCYDSGNVEYRQDPPAENWDAFTHDVISGLNALKCLQDQILSQKPLPQNNITYSVNRNLINLAVPQLTVEVPKDSMGDFSAHLLENPEINSNGFDVERDNNGKITNKLGYKEVPFKLIHKDVDNSISDLIKMISHQNPAVLGLARMTILFLFEAKIRGDSLLKTAYYKARFAVLPRTSLKTMFDSLEVADKEQYYQVMGEILNMNYQQSGRLGELTVKDENYHYFDNGSFLRLATFQQIFDSIVNIENASKLPILDSSFHERMIDLDKCLNETSDDASIITDILSCDSFAGMGDTSHSIGAMQMPAGASGIFEFRKLPPVDIESKGDILTMYKNMIDTFGGFKEDAQST